MLRIAHKSTDPCFVCKTTQNTARVKGESFDLVLCKDHAWEQVPEKDKAATTAKRNEAPGPRKGASHDASAT